MKKILLSVLALVSLLFASCQMQEPESGKLTGEVEFSITAGIPTAITTYADGVEAFSHQGGASNLKPEEYTLRYILQVFDKEGKVAYEEVKNPDEGTFGGVTFKARLLAKKYDFVFWADFVKEDGTEFYNVGNSTDGYDLKNITYKKEGITISDLASDAADAYTKVMEVDLTQSSQTLSEPVKLQRPFGKIRLLATDALGGNNKQEERPGEVTVDFKDAVIPSAFNALVQKVAEGATMEAGKLTFPAVCEDASVNNVTTGYENSYLLGYSYIFASGEIPSYSMDVEIEGNQGSGVIGTRSLSSIPVQANKLTTVIGNFYTNEGSIDVIVEDAFDGDDIEVPVTETLVVTPDDDLQKIIDEAENNAVIVLEPGAYSGNYNFIAGKSLTFRGANAGINPNTGSRQEETIFTGTLGASRLSTDKVFDMEIVIDGIKFTGEGTKIANSQYNAIGELTVQNCIFEPTTSENNFFIATNHNATESSRSTIRLINNHIGNTTTDYNSYYPVRLWAVKNVEVIGNVFEVDPGFEGLQHINISDLSGSEDASIIVKNNTFTNGPAGVTITSWKVGETPWSEDLFTGTIEITGNTFNNVGLKSIENPLRNNVPIFISPEYIDDDAAKGRAQDHGQFDADITVEDNTYNGELRENVIVNLTVHISTIDELKAAIKNQTDGQKWYIAAGEYDLGEPGQADTPGPNGYYFKVDKSLSIIGEGDVTITTSHDASSGMGSLQNLVTVNAENVSFENITFKANYNSYYSGPNKIIEVRNTGFSISDCKFIPNEKAPEDCGSAVYFSQNADNGVVKNCEINYATVSFDGLMKGNFTVKGNTFVEGNGNVAFTTPNWTQNDMAKSELYVTVEGNTFEGFEEYGEGVNPAVKVSYGILNLKDNQFPTGGIYWKAMPGSGIEGFIPNFGSVFVDYNSPVSQTWTNDPDIDGAPGYNLPKSFAISNDIIEFETTEVGQSQWQGRVTTVDISESSYWEVESTLTVTEDNQRVSKCISLFVDEEYFEIRFVQDNEGKRLWQYWYPDEDWYTINIEGITTTPGKYEIKFACDQGNIIYYLNGKKVFSYPTGITYPEIGTISLMSSAYDNSYKTTWTYPVIKF